jgi:hypothetical protein
MRDGEPEYRIVNNISVNYDDNEQVESGDDERDFP